VRRSVSIIQFAHHLKVSIIAYTYYKKNGRDVYHTLIEGGSIGILHVTCQKESELLFFICAIYIRINIHLIMCTLHS